MDNFLKDISIYYLILELLDGGETGLLPEIEPIAIETILAELRMRTDQDFGNNEEEWAKWFIGNDVHGTELERANLKISLQTQESMARIWRKIASISD